MTHIVNKLKKFVYAITKIVKIQNMFTFFRIVGLLIFVYIKEVWAKNITSGIKNTYKSFIETIQSDVGLNLLVFLIVIALALNGLSTEVSKYYRLDGLNYLILFLIFIYPNLFWMYVFEKSRERWHFFIFLLIVPTTSIVITLLWVLILNNKYPLHSLEVVGPLEFVRISWDATELKLEGVNLLANSNIVYSDLNRMEQLGFDLSLKTDINSMKAVIEEIVKNHKYNGTWYGIYPNNEQWFYIPFLGRITYKDILIFLGF